MIVDLFNWREGPGETLTVRVTPKASRERIAVELLPDGSRRIRVYVTAVAEGGRANRAVIELLADHLGIAKSRLSIVRGHTQRDKVIRISD